jgi:putative glutamine amidotransferase
VVKKAKKNPQRIKGKPVIGITCEVVKLKPYFSQFELVCDYRYVRAILRAGGIPVLLPLNPFRRDIPRLMDQIDGLVIIGGADIHPSFYGEKSRQKVQPIYRGRTYFDMRLLKEAEKKRKPMLCICYGMQLLNVYHGGTLHQDIQTELKGARNHRSKKNPLHKVEVQAGSLCHKIFGKTSVSVHSEHHQAVKLPGRNIKITAVSDDGIPEAIESSSPSIAIQWHPERQPKDPYQTKLFRHFIRMIKHERHAESKSEDTRRARVIERSFGRAGE